MSTPLPTLPALTRHYGHTVHGLYMLVMLAAAMLGPIITLLGPGIIGALCLLSIGYITLCRQFYWYGALAGFSLVGVLYIGLSYADVLPDAWTILYDRGYILRQAYFCVVLYPFILASHVMWQHAILRSSLTRYMLLLIASLLCVAPFLKMVIFTTLKSRLGPQVYFFYGMSNAELALWLALTYFLVVRFRGSHWVILPLCALLLALVSQTGQISIMAASLVILGLSPFWLQRILLVLLPAGMIGAAILSCFMAADLVMIDPNSALRSFFWRDALAGFMESHMMGVGFGKEATSNYYPEMGPIRRFAYHDYLVHGIHNSFLSMFFRLGIIGGGFFLWFFLVTCFPSRRLHPAVHTHASLVFFGCFVACFVNMGIESPKVLLGVALGLGYVLACNRLAERSEISRDMEGAQTPILQAEPPAPHAVPPQR